MSTFAGEPTEQLVEPSRRRLWFVLNLLLETGLLRSSFRFCCG